jgi:hypothetical protein
VLALIATLAVGLQLYSYPYVLAGAGAGAPTPLTTVLDLGLVEEDLGRSAAAATMLLGVLAALGLLAVLLVIATGLRIETAPAGRDEPRSGHWAAVAGSLLSLLVVLGVTGYGLWPWIRRLLQFPDPWAIGPDQQFNTWLPTLLNAAVGVVVALLAGYAIGGLRPLGRFSSLLLVPFAPWLFVGNGVLGVAGFRRFDEAGCCFGNFMLLAPPGWVVVAAVVLFTLLFRGLATRRQELSGLGLHRITALAVGRALPMLWMVGAATWLAQSQSLAWNRIVVGGPGGTLGMEQFLLNNTVPAVIAGQLADGYPASDFYFGLALPIWVILFFGFVLVVLQLTYLDQLRISVGRRR